MSTPKARVIVVGAGPGGLTAAMVLAHRGFAVQVFEKGAVPGGRNAYFEAKGYRFDIGPTFLMMRHVLDGVFQEAGKRSEDYLDFLHLRPMYRLWWTDGHMDVSDDKEAMKQEMARVFPDEVGGLARFMEKERWRYERLFPCLTRPYPSLASLLNKHVLSGVPAFSLGTSLYDRLGDYFREPEARIAFTFQSKYLGMSPWKCPGLFAMIPFVEHEFGIYHTKGGLSEISAAMAKVAEELGAEIRYDAPVKQVLVENKKAVGVELEDGTAQRADAVVVNADFGYAATNLFPPGVIKKWRHDRLVRKRFSVSTFMIYLGVRKRYDVPFHNIVFSKDYMQNVADLDAGVTPERNGSFYLRNASLLDPTVAPEGCSSLYLLMPVPNKKSDYDWQANKGALRQWCLEQCAQRLGLDDLEQHIEVERVITPDEWVSQYNVFLGATFNLAHNIGQMLMWRPHNAFEEVDGCYLVGGGTHPGSGLPTIYESGRISAGLICRRFGTQCGECGHDATVSGTSDWRAPSAGAR